MKKTLFVFASAALLFSACNNSSNTTEATPAAEAPAAEAPAAEAPAAPLSDAVVTITGDDNMKFDLTEIKVKEGQNVKLTLKHAGKAPVVAMGHNFVLLDEGVDLEAFAQAAVAAKDNDYIPKDKEGEVIAHTKTIGGGESTEIEFTAPGKGTYDFLCSFPGHYGMMKGKFIVE
ncbi:MAG: azurin [Chitinophagales bacterium]